MTTTIYLDEKTRELIREHKKQNPEFNLSSFVQKMVREYSMENEDIDIPRVRHEIANLNIEKEKLDLRINYLIKKIADFMAQKKSKIKTRTQEVDEFTESIKKYTKLDLKEATKLAEEFVDLKRKQTLTSFLTQKKVKFT